MANKVKNKVNLDKTLAFTTSSFAYKDPYNPWASFPNQILNKGRSFFGNRYIENEFIDFKTENVVP